MCYMLNVCVYPLSAHQSDVLYVKCLCVALSSRDVLYVKCFCVPVVSAQQ